MTSLTRYIIEVCDSQWQPLGQLENWDSLTMVHRVCQIGTGAVDAVATDANRELVGDGSGRTVIVYQDGVAQQAGLIRQGGEDEAGSGVIKLSWVDPLAYLAQEVAFPNPTSPTGQGPATHHAVWGHTTGVVLIFVNANVGPAALPGRRAPGLVMGPDVQGGVHLDVPVLARFDNLLELVSNVALPNGVVFEVDTVDRDHIFTARQVRDLSDSVIFSRRLNNIGSGEWSKTAPTATRITVLGPGEGTAQMIFEVTTPESLRQEASWGRVFRDQVESSSMVKDDVAAAAAKAEADNAKAWDKVVENAVRAAEDAWHDLDKKITKLDIQVDDATPKAQQAMDLGFKNATTISFDVGMALDSLPDDLSDVSADAQGWFDNLLRFVRGVGDAHGINDAMDDLQLPLIELYPEQQPHLDEVVQAFADVGNLCEAIFPARDNQVLFHAKADQFAAASVQADWDATYRSLYAEAERKLSEKGETVEASYQILEGSLVMGLDFKPGDLVAVAPEGLPYHLVKPVREFMRSVSVSGGDKQTIVVGDYGATSSTGQAFKTAEILAAVRRLQTGK